MSQSYSVPSVSGRKKRTPEAQGDKATLRVRLLEPIKQTALAMA
jgi:hypothetical protein